MENIFSEMTAKIKVMITKAKFKIEKQQKG